LKSNRKKRKAQSAAKRTSTEVYAKPVGCAEENGVSAAIAWLKSIRLDQLLDRMSEIDFRKDNALSELQELANSVEELIKSNRGGDTGIHGFIGERAQVYLSNAWSLINGDARICDLIDDNGMTDYFDNGIAIQQKACRSNGWLGLDHITKHKAKYPTFDGKYQIPKDFYETYERIGQLTEKEAGRLSRHEWNLWHEIQQVKQDGIIVEPMCVTYGEIQRDTIFNTIDKNEEGILKEAQAQADQATEKYKPTAKACIETAVISSAVEGTLSGAAKLIEKRCEGKRIKDYDQEDLKEVCLATAEGSVRGAVRGATVYLVENYTPIPGVVAGGAVSVAFESAKALKRYSDGERTGQECANEIGRSVVTSAAGALGAKLGGTICPIPIVGEVVGGFVFSMVFDKEYGIVAEKLRIIYGRKALQAA